ncbi:MAG: FecR family protein [Mariniphaga sp.]|nr:FecR family protein [Mariniphaga sp.]
MNPIDEINNFEFIHNPDFAEWVLRPSAESDRYWKTYISENPSKKTEIENARFLINKLLPSERSLSNDEISLLWNRIENTGIAQKRKFFNLKRWAIAASVAIILGFSGWMTLRLNTKNINQIDYKSIVVAITNPGNDIKLILSDNTEKTFTTKEVDLKYDRQGKLETKSGDQVQSEALSQNPEVEQMNQLVVPRGKRSMVELADGTKLWLNSGSRAIFPVVFNKKTREIYIEGEGYLEVAHDVSKPFYVVTDQIRLKVLGTKFDISAYKDDDHASVVLVQGSVQATIGSEKLMMKPDELLNYTKLTQKTTLEKTNILEYVSWKDGWMQCNKEQVQSIITKLSRYYDVKISYTDLRLNSLTLTGKLDLKSNCEDVFKVICATAPLKYEIIDNTIYLTMK